MKHALLGLRIFGVTLISLVPAMVMMAAGWPGALEPALFAMGAAMAGTVAGGFRFGVVMSVTVGLAAVISMPLGSLSWAAGAIMLVLGGIYGFWASFGYTSAAMLIPALVPYLIRDPPGIFATGKPTIDAGYLAAFFFIFVISGIWASLVMSKLVLKGKSFPGPTQRRRPAVIFGLLLGAIAGVVVAIAISVAPESQWAWITLTMFLLANPTGRIDPKQVRDRVTGTVIGLAVALLLSNLNLGGAALAVLAVVLITSALVVRIEKRPYWIFVMILTPAIVLMDAAGSNAETVAEQRLLFTLLGATITIAVTLLGNFAWSKYLAKHPNDVPSATAANASSDNSAN